MLFEELTDAYCSVEEDRIVLIVVKYPSQHAYRQAAGPSFAHLAWEEKVPRTIADHTGSAGLRINRRQLAVACSRNVGDCRSWA